jgi:hypothetical protein
MLNSDSLPSISGSSTWYFLSIVAVRVSVSLSAIVIPDLSVESPNVSGPLLRSGRLLFFRASGQERERAKHNEQQSVHFVAWLPCAVTLSFEGNSTTAY